VAPVDRGGPRRGPVAKHNRGRRRRLQPRGLSRFRSPPSGGKTCCRSFSPGAFLP